MINKVAFQSGYVGREVTRLMLFCIKNNIEHKFFDKLPPGWIPVGSIEWIEELIGTKKPDPYPVFLHGYLRRKYGPDYRDKRMVRGPRFVKPLDKAKRFDGHVVEQGSFEIVDGPIWVSEVIEFKQEWRYYVANGIVLCAAWYKGCDEDESAPLFPCKIPKNWSGAIDMGWVDGLGLELVEACAPYAVGWYGKEDDKYYEFLKNSVI